MKSIESRVEALETHLSALADREAIRELTARYCRAVTNDDMETLLTLFAEDGALDTTFPPGSGQDHTETRGLEALRETYQGTAGMQLKPCVHNHVIEVDGDRASGFCSVEIRLVQDGEAYTAAGHYEDTYRRADDGWRFERRSLVLYHWVRQTEGWA